MSSHAERQLRVRVLDALEQRIKQFARREELWPLRVPSEPIPLGAIVAQALGGEVRRFDPMTLSARTLLQLEWADGSTWTAWVCVLPSRFKVYGDTGHGETRVLASGGRNEGDESDRTFLELLAESGGGHFGIEMSGGAPVRMRSSFEDREFLIGMFVDLFEVTGSEDSVRSQLPPAHPASPDSDDHDFRVLVERWFDQAREARHESDGGKLAGTAARSSPHRGDNFPGEDLRDSNPRSQED